MQQEIQTWSSNPGSHRWVLPVDGDRCPLWIESLQDRSLNRLCFSKRSKQYFLSHMLFQNLPLPHFLSLWTWVVSDCSDQQGIQQKDSVCRMILVKSGSLFLWHSPGYPALTLWGNPGSTRVQRCWSQQPQFRSPPAASSLWYHRAETIHSFPMCPVQIPDSQNPWAS